MYLTILTGGGAKLSVSNPKNKYAAYVSVLSQISNCQGLGRKNKHEFLKADRTKILISTGGGAADAFGGRAAATAIYIYISLPIHIYLSICISTGGGAADAFGGSAAATARPPRERESQRDMHVCICICMYIYIYICIGKYSFHRIG